MSILLDIAPAAQEQPILTNTIVVGIVGSIIVFLFLATLRLLWYMWKERKKMFTDERTERIAAETELKTDIQGIKDSVQERKEAEIKLTGSIENLDETIAGVKSWLSSVSKDQKTMTKNLAEITGMVQQIQNTKS